MSWRGFVLGSAVQRALTDQELDLDRIRMLLDAARHDGVNLNISCLESALRERLNAEVEQWARKPGDPEALGMVVSGIGSGLGGIQLFVEHLRRIRFFRNLGLRLLDLLGLFRRHALALRGRGLFFLQIEIQRHFVERDRDIVEVKDLLAIFAELDVSIHTQARFTPG